MEQVRRLEYVAESRPTLEGAGVHLNRAFGYAQVPRFDPFLMLDDFRGDDPDQYVAGFPWHPHRGIETITYMLEGSVEHGDSLGNKGVIAAGGVQWMTAGSGIIHQEMPVAGPGGRMGGFQLWANLPAAQKMMKPRYREITAGQIPLVRFEGGSAKVVAGVFRGTRGPVDDVVIAPEYLDVKLEPGAVLQHPTVPGHSVFIYVHAGSLGVGERMLSNRTLALFGDGDHIRVFAGPAGAGFLLVSGRPLREPVAWGGPIVMNTEEEIRQAFEDYRRGTFIRP